MSPLAPVTVMRGQFETQGPLPPLAQPLAIAKLNKAAANRKFFIIGSLLEGAGNRMFPDQSDLGRLPGWISRRASRLSQSVVTNVHELGRFCLRLRAGQTQSCPSECARNFNTPAIGGMAKSSVRGKKQSI
jgi:hypothetical protein